MRKQTTSYCLISRAILPLLLLSGLCLLAPVAEAQLLFQDNLESGTGNWSVYAYPGAPTCTPLTYASTATDPNANHTPGGAFGFKLTQPSDRMVHDLTPSSYGSVGLHLSLWYYDAMNLTGSDFEAFDLRTANNSQILGFATRGPFYQQPEFYWCRVLSVTGFDPTYGFGYRVSSIRRTPGWHHLEILQYRDLQHTNTADFYVDGVLGLHETDVVDAQLTRLVLGLGWGGNDSQTGYVDDITLQVIPEPGVLALAVAALPAAVLFRRSRGQRSR